MKFQVIIDNIIKNFQKSLNLMYNEKSNILKYISVSLISYFYILILLYFLVSKLNHDKLYSYVFVYISVYVIEYTLTLIFVFKKTHSTKKFFKFIIYILLFLCISSILYKYFLILKVNYLIGAILVAIILMPLRYFFNKLWVYE